MLPVLYNYNQYPSGYNVPNPFGVPNLEPKMNESIKSNVISYTLLFFLIVFFIIIVVLLFVNTTTRSKLINPSDCPVIKSDYAIIPSTNLSSLSIINNCSGNPDGYQGNQPCTFSNITSVFAAQQLCNQYQTNICGGFAYNPTSGIVNFVNTNFNITSVDGNVNPADVYVKQNV
jgi:quinol-cytochrome oxidoreductase complex cytochrome b subunit